MANPVLVEITRGDLVESVHRGSVVISDARGHITFSLGEIHQPVYPRSSLKPFQALPLIESGAADAFGLGSEEIALACASHSGEPMHTERVKAWLERIGCTESDLACGTHPIRYEPVAEQMVIAGLKPTRVHNNCSGKHTGFLTVARHWNVATEGYERIDHPVQQAVGKSLGEMAGVEEMSWGVDGCAAPSFGLPLGAFARALARLAAPQQLPEGRRAAVKRIVDAMIAHPDLVSGTGRSCNILMRAAKGRVAVKTGAEGFYAAIVPEYGLGIAVKVDDGAGRGAECVMAAILHKLELTGDDKDALKLMRGPVLNTRGDVVGEHRPAPMLMADPLESLIQ